MKIASSLEGLTQVSVLKSQNKVNAPNKYDLDISVEASGSKALKNERITSQSLCTPGCGNTGTMNSFCC